jgi:hypothetical protein
MIFDDQHAHWISAHGITVAHRDVKPQAPAAEST